MGRAACGKVLSNSPLQAQRIYRFRTYDAMNKTQRILSVFAISASALVLAACDQSKPPTVGEKVDAGIAQTQEAATDAKLETQAAGNELKQDASQLGTDIADGSADMAITAKVKTALAGDDQLSALAIEVDTTNKVVILTGPAPTAAAVDRATALAQAVEGVVEVKNMLVVSGTN